MVTQVNVAVAAVMAGGKARRMGGVLKPLINVCGAPMIQRVIESALRISRHVAVITSPRTTHPLISKVSSLVNDPHLHLIEAPGEGYVSDLRVATASLRKPLLILPADVPLVTPAHLQSFLELAGRFPSADVVTLVVEGRGPVGISLFRSEGGCWASVVFRDDGMLTNVNTWEDLRRVEAVCRDLNQAWG